MLRHGLRVLAAIGAALVWGGACGALHAPFWVVLIGGLFAAILGFWLEREVLAGPETASRNDFAVIAAAGYAFLAVLGVGLASLGDLAATWVRL